MKSLRVKLLVGVGGAAVTILIIAAVTLYTLARVHQIRQLDDAVRDRARLLVSMVEIDGNSPELGFDEIDLRDFQSAEGGWYLETWFDDQTIFRSGSLDAFDIDLTSFGGASRAVWCDLPDGARGRGVMHSFELFDELEGSKLTLLVAADARSVLQTMDQLALLLCLVTGIAVVVMSLVTVGLIAHAMKPVRALADQIAATQATDLETTLTVESLPSELQPVADQFNALMSRLHTAFERERGFCSDIAHELRTPLAGLRATLEITGSRPRSTEQYTEAIDTCQEMVIQTQGLIESLLDIGKLESGQINLEPQSVDVNEMMRRLWSQLETSDVMKPGVKVDWAMNARRSCSTDVRLLELALRNVLSNAMQYVDANGRITLTIESPEDQIMVTVSNTGSLVSAEDADKVFERLWRGAESRSHTGSHFGLGLSLARRAIESIGGRICVATDSPGEFRVILQLSDLPNR